MDPSPLSSRKVSLAMYFLFSIYIYWQCNVKAELSKLEGTVSIIKVVLLDAKEQHRSNNREVTVWLKRLKDAIYDVDHLLDDFSTKVLRRKTMKGNEMSKKSSAGSLNAKIFTFLASLCLFSFSVGVLTDPGYAPSSYLPDVEDSSSVSDEEPKKNGVQSKYCDKCAAYKPPRAHHCRVCRRCILRMDHHCLWINNCVGYWNYKAFFTLVLYATIGSIHSTIIVISCACQKDWNYSGRTPLKIFYTSFIHIRGPVKVLSCLWSNDGCIICNTWDSLRLAYLPNNSQYDNHRGVGSQHAEMVMASINQPSERWS
ncbi:hypothetical protein QUC31_006367 [Theobroma cacao]